MTWHLILFEDALAHWVCDDLRQEVIDDLVARGAKFREERVVTEWGIDMPGIVRCDRPVEEFEFEGCQVTVPSEDVSAFLIRLRHLPLRQFPNGKQFVKLHGFMRAATFTPSQHIAFREKLDQIALRAVQRTRNFDEQTLPADVFSRIYGRLR